MQMYEYWYVQLPVKGNVRLRGESTEDHVTRELNELAARGWEVVGTNRGSPIGPVDFVLRMPKA